MRRSVDVQAVIDRVNRAAVSRPNWTVAAFVLLTVVFAAGMPLVSTGDGGTGDFAEDVPAFDAQEKINQEFGPTFTGDDQSTQVIQQSQNVLARSELVRSMKLIEQADRRSGLRVTGAAGPAPLVAQTLDPTARTPAEKRRALERASDREVRRAVEDLAANPAFERTLSSDFNPQEPSASASITVISHSVPTSDDDELETIQLETRSLADRQTGDFRVFGGGIQSAEFGNVIGDSLAIVVPVVIVLILLFLVVAYRDPVDLVLGLVALIMTIIWTFGFIGYAGIPFDQQQIAVPVLLLAVGIDFGIHIVNRYREELENGLESRPAMVAANRQLVVAFFIVTVTTVFGFGANLISDLGPTRRFGLVSAVGIIFTFLIFGVFLPSAKLIVDGVRDDIGFPEFGSKPLASEDSAFGRLLAVSVSVTRYAPVLFVVAFLLAGGVAGVYGQEVDRSFDTDDFLPPEELPAYITALPEPFAPSEYTVTETINFLERNFETTQGDSVTLYVQGPFRKDQSLAALDRRNRNPPDTFVTVDGDAEADSILTVIESQRARDPEFAALVARNDRDGDGIPDQNLDRIYDELDASNAGTSQYITDDRRAVRVVYSVEGDADSAAVVTDAQAFADEFRYSATATGGTVVFDQVADVIFESAIASLVLAIGTVAVFLVLVYGVLERRPMLGVANMIPILITVACLVATMRVFGIALNALTASLLSITIGVGIAYSVHFTHRFIDEYRVDNEAYESLRITLTGTGGALTGSMLTTSIGTGALILAITPVLGTFGLLMAVSVFYSYLTAIVVLPPTLLIWSTYVDGRVEPMDVPGIRTPAVETPGQN
jgi:predicted RND superfamily exporter protein